MKKKLIVVLLVLVMVFAMIPAASAAEAGPITLDFMSFARQAASQSWWSGLNTTRVDSVRAVGTPSGTAPSAAHSQAVASMETWLDNNANWNIEDLSNGNAGWFTYPTGGKRLFIDSEASYYGLRFYTDTPRSENNLSKLMISFDAPQAGEYILNIETFNEKIGWATVPSLEITSTGDDLDEGGATVDMYMNGSLICEDYCFRADQDRVETVNFGTVNLQEGKNVLTLYVVGDYWGANNAGRCAFNLRSIEFTPGLKANVREYETVYLNLNDAYNFDDRNVENFTAYSSDEWVAAAAIGGNGVLAVTGVKAGNAAITVMEGEEEVCTVDVTVSAYTGTLDQLMGDPTVMDFATTMDRASEQTWWEEFASSGKVTGSDSLSSWLKNTAKWQISSVSGSMIADTGEIPFVLDGTANFTVDLPAAGLYSVRMEYLCDGGVMDISLNGGSAVELDTLFGDPVTDSNLGAFSLKKGSNTVKISSDSAVYLRKVIFTPLGGVQTEAGVDTYIDLIKTYFPYTETISPSRYTVTSSNTTALKAAINSYGQLVLRGQAAGTSVVTVKSPSGLVYNIAVNVLAAAQPQNVSYTLDGYTAATLQVGSVAEGDLTALTTNNTVWAENYVRKVGTAYFYSSDPYVATVDQDTGDVTCVGEGTAKITAYVVADGISLSTGAMISVTDDTDLASLEVGAVTDYISTEGSLQMEVSGKKSSGVKADMGLYPVQWSVDDTSIATITADGKLYAHKEGTVTVTATANVMKKPVQDTMQVKVVSSTELPGYSMTYDFTYNRHPDILTYSIAEEDVAINRELTTDSGSNVILSVRGLHMQSAAGQQLALDLRIRRSGWYQVELRGSAEENTNKADGFMDNTFVGSIDYADGSTNTSRGGYNAVWLDAGVHTLRLVATTAGQQVLGGVRLYPAQDPQPVEITFAPEKTELIVNEKIQAKPVIVTGNQEYFHLLQQTSVPNFDNYYIVTSSNPGVVAVSGDTLTAKATGSATISMTGKLNGTAVSKSFTVTVKGGTVAYATLTANKTTVRPGSDWLSYTLQAYNASGTAISLPSGASLNYATSNANVATVTAYGNIIPGNTEGSAKISITITETSGHTTEAAVWITVTQGKTEPTVYTNEERAAAQENVLKYDWAKAEKDAVMARADLYAANVKHYYEQVLFPQTWPGNSLVTYAYETGYMTCPYCKNDLSSYNAYYPWVVDPLNNPWKVRCPACSRSFPSNDFESYYKSGLGTDGLFHKELANTAYLTNTLYPEMGAGWGVDDGWGWDSGSCTYTFISHYIRKSMCPFRAESPNSFLEVLECLRKAYLYTGDEKYGNAGAILIDRLADIYATYDISDFPIGDYGDNDGMGGAGIMFGAASDGLAATEYAQAADAFWPCMVNTEVVDFISGYAAWKGLSAADITADYIRTNVEENLLLKIWQFLQSGDIEGNFGIHQSACAYTAVALDRMPESQQMLEWQYAPSEKGGSHLNGTAYSKGGEVLNMIMKEVNRDGLGNEGSLSYNSGWETDMLNMLTALAGYDSFEGSDLWQNSKLVTMFSVGGRLMTGAKLGVNLHETSSRYQTMGKGADVEQMLRAFLNSGNIMLAQQIYAFNGHTTDGLRGDIFTKDPEAGVQEAIENIVAQYGEWDMANSDMMPGYGLAMLKDGPAKYRPANATKYSQIWMYYGDLKSAHHHKEALNLDLDAFGLNLSGNMGYSLRIDNNFTRLQWDTNTISNNTVVVDEQPQIAISEGGFPMHFTDDDNYKVMDADVSHAYEETDIYRRTVVQVDNGSGVNYSVDFFRVLGGKDHVYSFHAASQTDPTTTGLDLVKQPVGTYAGREIPFGPYYEGNVAEPSTNIGSGFSWLYDVARDNKPSTKFSVDWAIKDFYGQTTATNIHLKMTMLSDKPFTEVATAHGKPSQNGVNPEFLEWLLVRNTGNKGLDTLFTTIIEPYQRTAYIRDAELVPMTLSSGTEKVHDVARALKVTLVSGRVDYVMYATNPDCTYLVDGKIPFKGFTGVVSYETDETVHAWGDEVTQVGNMIKNAMPRVTGKVTDFTKDILDSNSHYTMTVTMDQTVTADQLIDKWIYVDNDGTENAAYRIYDAKVSGNTATLYLSFQTLIREYMDDKDMARGFRYNISEGDTYTIPLSATGDTVEEEVPNVTKFDIPGCAPNLESELEMGIAIPKAAIPADHTFTAVVTQVSGGQVVNTFTFPQSQWKSYNSALSMVYVKMAAKCMADDFSIEVIDEDGNVWNNPYKTSYRTYVSNNIDKTTDEARKTLFVDMLNYGAAAQNRFSYNTGDLANNQLTAEDQALSLGKVNLINKQVMGKYNLGSTVSLESRILVYSVFKGLTNVENMYAKVTFTDARGNEKTTTIPGTEFELFNASQKAYKICVNNLVPADINVAYTMTVYNANGTVYDTAVEGLGSYLSRNSGKDPVFDATATFGIAARNFFAPTQDTMILDFKAAAAAAANQSWWADLLDTNVEGIKAVGPLGTPPTSAHIEAVKGLSQWLDTNTNWNIYDLTDGSAGWYTHPSGSGKQIALDPSGEYYGMRFYTNNYGEDRLWANWARVILTVDVFMGGEYNMTVDTYLEKPGDTTVPSPSGQVDDHGGAATKVFINRDWTAETAPEPNAQYTFSSFADAPGRTTVDLGTVTLNKGTNVVEFFVIGSAGGTAINLDAITFTPA